MFNQTTDPIAGSLVQSGVMRRVAPGRTVHFISKDLRILAVLIAFGLGALLQALAGFGAPVAIATAMLIVVGMKPLRSALVALVAISAPLAFGAMGAPTIALVVPLLLVYVVDGRRGLRQTWPVALVAGVVFSMTKLAASSYPAIELTEVIAAVVTVAAVTLMVRFWQPAQLIGSEQVEEEAESQEVYLVWAGTPRSAAANSDTASRPAEDDSSPFGRCRVIALAPYLIIIALLAGLLWLQSTPVLGWMVQ